MGTPQNPDFNIESKKRIAAVVREVESYSDDNRNRKRPADPRGGGSALPKGQYTYMVLQVVASNQIGFDMVCAHPMLPS